MHAGNRRLEAGNIRTHAENCVAQRTGKTNGVKIDFRPAGVGGQVAFIHTDNDFAAFWADGFNGHNMRQSDWCLNSSNRIRALPLHGIAMILIARMFPMIHTGTGWMFVVLAISRIAAIVAVIPVSGENDAPACGEQNKNAGK